MKHKKREKLDRLLIFLYETKRISQKNIVGKKSGKN